ncbi:Ribosomal protein S27 [Penicillium canescens]|uniref:40S ribosomal protein S27 n=1 Tax=Penicillium canescens TaxID=5083 RepID=A0AAD6N3H6_PENCN|nr:Ribosomal protein S27 [Penicillium canescens]KAJ6009329.1 Ribosomal protein S27 [Penicillium canescens]KAJ6027160.1 Ribosomal protein S27 [Penicillium canescens]KAJ6040442.1 Ribosomal protein S27 [Penicillium canescens]KAJ6067202.1 Ribosomal protein S27 [Penicillium canescens]KAJ6085634.1 Ribosomal protein S27 [Penicillium canescens]
MSPTVDWREACRLPERGHQARAQTGTNPTTPKRDARSKSLQTSLGRPPHPLHTRPSPSAPLINYLADRLSLVKMVLAVDLLNPTPQAEGRKHKLKTLVPQPRSFFMDVKCPGCFTITTVFSHAQTVVICAGCSTVLCQPTGGKARLTEGCSFRRK